MDLSFALGDGTQERKEPVPSSPGSPHGAWELTSNPQACEDTFSTPRYHSYNLFPAVRDRDRAEGRRVQAEHVQERPECGAERALLSVLGLERKAEVVRPRCAEEAFGSSLGCPAGQGLHQMRVQSALPADQLRVGAHRGGDPL